MAGKSSSVSSSLVESVATTVSRELNIPTNKTLAMRIITAHTDAAEDFEGFAHALQNYGKFRETFITGLYRQITAAKYAQINADSGGVAETDRLAPSMPVRGGLIVRKKENDTQPSHEFSAPSGSGGSKLGLDRLAAIKRKEKSEEEIKSPKSKKKHKVDHEQGKWGMDVEDDVSEEPTIIKGDMGPPKERAYRGERRMTTPSDPGGVDRDKLEEIERRKRDRDRHTRRSRGDDADRDRDRDRDSERSSRRSRESREECKVFVGGLAWSTTDDALRQRFEEVAGKGSVSSAKVVMDKEDSSRSRGFAFVEFSSKDVMENAIERLDGSELDGRAISVNQAKPRQPRGSTPSRSEWEGGNTPAREGARGGWESERSVGGGKAHRALDCEFVRLL